MSLKNELEKKLRESQLAKLDETSQQERLQLEKDAKFSANQKREQDRINSINRIAEQSGLIGLFNETISILEAKSNISNIELITYDHCSEYEHEAKPKDLYYNIYTLTWLTGDKDSYGNPRHQQISVYVNLQGVIMFFPRYTNHSGGNREIISYNYYKMETHNWKDTILPIMWRISKKPLTERFAHYLANPQYGSRHDPNPVSRSTLRN